MPEMASFLKVLFRLKIGEMIQDSRYRIQDLGCRIAITRKPASSIQKPASACKTQ
jgi:hypothetical protein